MFELEHPFELSGSKTLEIHTCATSIALQYQSIDASNVQINVTYLFVLECHLEVVPDWYQLILKW